VPHVHREEQFGIEKGRAKLSGQPIAVTARDRLPIISSTRWLAALPQPALLSLSAQPQVPEAKNSAWGGVMVAALGSSSSRTRVVIRV
jgi:hypothetical protein